MYKLNLMGFDKQEDNYLKRAGKVLSEEYKRTAADLGKMFNKGKDGLDSTINALRELYKNGAEKIQAYANGPSADSSCNALSSVLNDKEITAMNAYIDAQRIIYAGMRSR